MAKFLYTDFVFIEKAPKFAVRLNRIEINTENIFNKWQTTNLL